MPTIELLVGEPRRTFARDWMASDGWTFSFPMTLAQAWHQRVELTTDHNFEKLEGILSIQNEVEKEQYKDHKNGSLQFAKEGGDEFFGWPARIFVTLRMRPDDCMALRTTLADGIPLKSISIDVPIEHGWAPDGSRKKWDNKANPTVELEGYKLHFGEPEEPEERQHVLDIEPKVSAEMHKLSRIATDVRYGFYVLCGCLIALIVIARAHWGAG